MELISAFAQTFQVTQFDVLFFLVAFFATVIAYYFLTLHILYEIAFGAIVGLGVYIMLSVLLLGNTSFGTQGGLLPFGFSVFIISIVVYLVFILAVLFPIHGGLVISETTNPILYTLQYIFVGIFLSFSLFAVFVYMVEQTYVFQVGTIFTWFRTLPYYVDVVRPSMIFSYVMTHQNIIIPLGVLLMIYKLLLSNLISAIILSIWYNLSSVGFYRKKDDSHYRVEFHEVGGGHAHAGDAGHDDHAPAGHDDHGGHH